MLANIVDMQEKMMPCQNFKLNHKRRKTNLFHLRQCKCHKVQSSNLAKWPGNIAKRAIPGVGFAMQ